MRAGRHTSAEYESLYVNARANNQAFMLTCNVCKVDPMSRVRVAQHTSAEYDDPSESRMGRVIKCFG